MKFSQLYLDFSHIFSSCLLVLHVEHHMVSLSFWNWYFKASIDVARVEKNIKDNMTIFVAIVDWTSKANKQAFRSE